MLRYYSNTITKIVPSIFHLSLSLLSPEFSNSWLTTAKRSRYARNKAKIGVEL